MDSASYVLTEILAEHAATGAMWHEFLRVPDLSVGVYVVPAGGDDPQSPHNEDEVYVVLSGKGMLRAGDDEYAVEPGSVLYVAKQVPHHFHDVTEALRVLVFFAPAHTD
ncbi:MAG: cupin domain-containing protein [Thermomicrobiales bacterium]|nr:cupin domain-containing protein [Thermomicrobiales bacterium]